jgi:hypothetical protein
MIGSNIMIYTSVKYMGRNRLESARVGLHGSGPRRAPGGIIKL